MRRKDWVSVSMRIDREVWRRLKDYAEKKEQNYTVTTEKILKSFLDNESENQS